ncbi:MAG: hypothetical protein LBT29_00090 [Flavobacteriaceae bacterium]|jgi:hypothetical protein|nr:hypothetical protein [Flavobacteriaceae bacterium]
MKSYLDFEKLTKEESGKLLGGFSSVFSAGIDAGDEGANNCKGGNCKEGCNNGKKKKREPKHPIPNANCGAGVNCVEGCGKN